MTFKSVFSSKPFIEIEVKIVSRAMNTKMQALMAEIKNAVFLLTKDSEPEDLRMRVCMAKTIELMVVLRNTFVESGQYGELVINATSRILKECRQHMSVLFRRVPCNAGGGKVNSEVQRFFHQTMDVVISKLANNIRESLSKESSGDPGRKLENNFHDLRFYEEPTISEKENNQGKRDSERGPANDLSSKLLEFELGFQKMDEENEKLQASREALRTDIEALRDANQKLRDKLKNTHYSRHPMPDGRSKCSPLSKSCQTSCIVVKEKHDEVLPQSENKESQVTLETGRTQDLQIDKPMISTISTTDPLFKDLPKKDEIKKTLRDESRQGRQVLWDQKDKPLIPTSFTNDLLLKSMQQPEPKVVLESPIHGKIEKSLRTDSRQDLGTDKPMIPTISTTDPLFKNLKQPEKDGSLVDFVSLMVESPQDVKVLWAQKNMAMIQTSSTSADLFCKVLPETKPEPGLAFVGTIHKDSKINLGTESRPDWEAFLAKINKLMNEKSSTLDTSVTSFPSIPSSSSVTISPKSTISFNSVGKTLGDHRQRLLHWCKERTKCYGLPMYEFSQSWRSGRALVALIHSYRQDLIETRFLSKESPLDTLTYGVGVARSLGVTCRYDIVKECLRKKPDFWNVFQFIKELERCLLSQSP